MIAISDEAFIRASHEIWKEIKSMVHWHPDNGLSNGQWIKYAVEACEHLKNRDKDMYKEAVEIAAEIEREVCARERALNTHRVFKPARELFPLIVKK